MPLTSSQKHYIKKNIQNKSPEKIAEDLNLPAGEVWRYIKNHWPREKYEKLLFNKPIQKNSQFLAKNKFELKKFFIDNLNYFTILFILALGVYLNSFGNGFVSDDIPAFVNNPELGKASQIFGHGIIGSSEQFIFFLGYKLGGATPGIFRFFNIFFHLGSTFLVFLIVSLSFRKRIAFIAALLFTVHPILSESVAWISGIPYSMSAFFVFLTLFLYVYKEKIIWPMIFFFIALLTLEKVMIFPFILLLYEFSFGGWENVKKKWKILAPFLGLSFLWIFIFLGKLGGRTSALETISYQQDGGGLYNPFFQIPIAIGNYLKLIFWPDKLTLYHTEMSFNTGQYLAYLSLLLLFFGFVFWSFKKNRQVFFWLSFFFVSLLPVLTPLKIAWIVAERYVYLGSVGIFVALAFLFDWIFEKTKNKSDQYKYGAIILFAVLILSLSTRTIVRNMDWKNEDTLWIATAEVSPSGQNIHNNLGDVYGRQGNLEKAVEEFQKAIEINPRYADAYHNLGNAYRDMGKIDLAMESYQKALEFNPNLWQSYQNLAAIYYSQGDYQKALEYMQSALKIVPDNQNILEAIKTIEGGKK